MNEVMRLGVRYNTFSATEVVLLGELGENEVFGKWRNGDRIFVLQTSFPPHFKNKTTSVAGNKIIYVPDLITSLIKN
jgi:hypothetical protein